MKSSSAKFTTSDCVKSHREAARGDRPLGSAKRDFETIHVGKTYDIHLRSEDGAEANIEKLLVAWRNGGRSSSFVELKSA